MKKWLFAVGLVGGSLLLGGTVLREPIAYAAQSVSATIVGPLDANGNVAVHEQGTADVNVTNTDLGVHGTVSVSTPSPISSGAREAGLEGGVDSKNSDGTRTVSVINADMTPGILWLSALHGRWRHRRRVRRPGRRRTGTPPDSAPSPYLVRLDRVLRPQHRPVSLRFHRGVKRA